MQQFTARLINSKTLETLDASVVHDEQQGTWNVVASGATVQAGYNGFDSLAIDMPGTEAYIQGEYCYGPHPLQNAAWDALLKNWQASDNDLRWMGRLY